MATPKAVIEHEQGDVSLTGLGVQAHIECMGFFVRGSQWRVSLFFWIDLEEATVRVNQALGTSVHNALGSFMPAPDDIKQEVTRALGVIVREFFVDRPEGRRFFERALVAEKQRLMIGAELKMRLAEQEYHQRLTAYEGLRAEYEAEAQKYGL